MPPLLADLLYFLAIVALVWFINFIYSSLPDKKLGKLFAEVYSDKAKVQGICMVREDRIWGPAVAQIIDEKLIVQNVRGNKIVVPTKEIHVTREYLSFGKIGWLGKRVFAIKSPHTILFALGINPSEACVWRKALNAEK